MKVRKTINQIKNLFSKKNINFALILLFCVLLPTQLGRHWFFDFSYVNGVKIDYLSPTLYSTDIIFFLLFIFNFRYFLSLFSKNKKNVFIVIVFLLINIIFSKVQMLAAYRGLKIVEVVFLYLFFSKLKETDNLLKYFFCGGVFVLVLTILQFFFGHSLQTIFYFFGERSFSLSTPGIAKVFFSGVEFLRPYATFSHPNSMAGFYLLLYFFVLTNKFKDIKIKKYALIIFSFLIFFTFSKTAAFVYLVLNFAYLLHIRSNNLKKILFKMFPILLIAIFLVLLKTDPLSFDKRIVVYGNSLSIIMNNSFLGAGFGHYLYYQAHFPMKYSYFFLQPVHNIYLLLISETGIFFSFYLFFLIIKKNWKKIFVDFSFTLCFFVVLLTGIMDHYWLTLQQNWLLLGVVFGLLHNKYLRPEIDDVRIIRGELKP